MIVLQTLVEGLGLINSVGVIDGDYYGSPGNEGHTFAQMKNITDQRLFLKLESVLSRLSLLLS